MTSEVLTIDPSASMRILWARRWALVATVAIASLSAYLAASALPQTWESQAVVQVGQVGAAFMETAASVVRRVNVGTFQCDAGSGPATEHWEGVNALLEGGPEFKEVRLVARGRTADQAYTRADAAANCIVGRHRQPFDAAERRDGEFRAALESQIGLQKNNIANVTRMVERASSSGSNPAEALLLVTRLGDERAQLLELSRRLQAFGMEHALDAPTSIASPASHPAFPIWPRRGLLAAVTSAVALLLGALFVLFAPAKSTAT